MNRCADRFLPAPAARRARSDADPAGPVDRGVRGRPVFGLLSPLTAAALAALGVAGGAHGQTAPAPATATATAPVTELDSVVISGSPRERRLLDAPYAITAVRAEALRSAGPMINLSEALVRVPGLNVANRNNYAQDLQVSSRGFGARATFGVRGLRLYADGIPASMPDGQGQVGHFDLAGAERVEVLRGPYSALYGNSSGGVISVISAPVVRPRLELALDAGQFGLRQRRLAAAAPLGDGWDAAVSLTRTDFDGFRPQSAARRELATVRLGWRDDDDRLTLQFNQQSQQAQDPLGLSRAQFDADPRQTTAQALTFDTRKSIGQSQLGVAWTHRYTDAGPLVSSQASVYAGERGVVQYLAIAPGTQTPARHGGGVVDFDRAYDGVDARLTWRWDEVDLVTGLSVERQSDDRRGWENFTGTGTTQRLGVIGRLRRDELNTARTNETYAQAEWAFAPQWAATAGARVGRVALSAQDRFLSNGDDSGRLDFSYVTPVVGLRYQPDPDLTLHASAARGFESPTLGELAYRADGQTGFNTALQPQRSLQLELGAKLRAASTLRLDATAFLIDTSDEIGVATNAGGRSAFQNVGRTRRYGAELGLAWTPSPVWRAQAALSWLSAHYRDSFLTCAGIPCTTPTLAVPAGNRIAGTQAGSAWAELAWLPRPDSEGAVEWRALGATPVNDSNSERAPGWALVNLRWLERFPIDGHGRIELLGRVDNVFDRRWVGSVIVNDANGRYYEPGSPRAALVSLRYVRQW